MRKVLWVGIVAAVSNLVALSAQESAPVGPPQFDVVSIKRSTGGPGASGGMRTLPDGTMIMVNHPISSIITAAAPVPVREVVGLPDWAMRERYDLTTKPPAASTREQRTAMMRHMFAERMKLVAHVEERERDTYSLVLARSDGRLGPDLRPSTLDCTARSPAGPPPQSPPSVSDMQHRCGMAMGPGSIVSGGLLLDALAIPLGALAGRLVNNRTGLQGFYAITLRFATPHRPDAPADHVPDDLPEIFTALQEQLGLKLQPEKTQVSVLVVDHIERPSEN